MTKLKPYQLLIISSILLVLAWPPLPTAFLLFIAFVPLLILRNNLESNSKKHMKFWLWTLLCLFVFNIGTTWWVWNASASGAIMMLFANTLIMSLPFLGYSYTRDAYPKLAGLSFIMYFLAFEFWHFNWSASWPWLTLGKGLASFPSMIQWYEYTGESGGTLFVLICNYWIFRVLVLNKLQKIWQPISFFAGIYLLSIGILYLSKDYSNKETIECVVSQPNIDPYEEKFGHGLNYLYPEIQVELALEPSVPLITASTDLLLLPETAVVGYNKESELENNFIIEPLKKITVNTNLNVLTGSETFELYQSTSRPSTSARYDSSVSRWFDFYNSAMLIRDGEVDSIYHKSKLVPGVEKMPFQFLEALSIELGGSSGSLGISKSPINFTLKKGQVVAPLICYESVFGEYVAEFVKKGAVLLTVVTNDGWWGETPGYKQHLLYGAIRCIETRREMIRSANTGISAHIDQYGRILQATKYNERVAFKCHAKTNNYTTFYVKYGDLIGKTSILSILILLSALVKLKVNKP